MKFSLNIQSSQTGPLQTERGWVQTGVFLWLMEVGFQAFLCWYTLYLFFKKISSLYNFLLFR